MNTQARQGMFVLAAAATLGIASGCKDDNAPRSQARITQPATAASQATVRRARDLRAQTAWVGKLHNELVADLLKQRKALGKNATATAVCGAMLSTLENHAVRAEQQQGIVRSVNERRRFTQQVGALYFKSCQQEIGPASMFNAPRLTPPALPLEGYVTGAFEPYVNALEGAVNSTNGAPDQVNVAVNGVVEAAVAAGIPEADLNVVAATAGLAYESSSYWYSTSGGANGDSGDVYCNDEFNCGDGNNEVYMTSVFKTKRGIWGKLLGVVAVDLVGCIAQEVKDYRSGNVSEHDMYVNCGISGGAASASSVIKYMI
jgi:hypothetical protein